MFCDLDTVSYKDLVTISHAVFSYINDYPSPYMQLSEEQRLVADRILVWLAGRKDEETQFKNYVYERGEKEVAKDCIDYPDHYPKWFIGGNWIDDDV